MKLHHDKKLFPDTLRAASQHLDIKLDFVEKDYWITLVLSRLTKSKYADKSVFKSSTSISKEHNLIERFSEDLDIAIINDKAKTGNKIKSIIRAIEKEINETIYWLELLKETYYLTPEQFESVNTDAVEIIKIVTSIVKSVKANIKNRDNDKLLMVNGRRASLTINH